MAKRGEPFEEEGYIYGSLKKLAIGLRFKFQTMSDRAGQSPTGPDKVW
jgi:hypothetical protein